MRAPLARFFALLLTLTLSSPSGVPAQTFSDLSRAALRPQSGLESSETESNLRRTLVSASSPEVNERFRLSLVVSGKTVPLSGSAMTLDSQRLEQSLEELKVPLETAGQLARIGPVFPAQVERAARAVYSAGDFGGSLDSLLESYLQEAGELRREIRILYPSAAPADGRKSPAPSEMSRRKEAVQRRIRRMQQELAAFEQAWSSVLPELLNFSESVHYVRLLDRAAQRGELVKSERSDALYRYRDRGLGFASSPRPGPESGVFYMTPDRLWTFQTEGPELHVSRVDAATGKSFFVDEGISGVNAGRSRFLLVQETRRLLGGRTSKEPLVELQDPRFERPLIRDIACDPSKGTLKLVLDPRVGQVNPAVIPLTASENGEIKTIRLATALPAAASARSGPSTELRAGMEAAPLSGVLEGASLALDRAVDLVFEDPAAGYLKLPIPGSPDMEWTALGLGIRRDELRDKLTRFFRRTQSTVTGSERVQIFTEKTPVLNVTEQLLLNDDLQPQVALRKEGDTYTAFAPFKMGHEFRTRPWGGKGAVLSGFDPDDPGQSIFVSPIHSTAIAVRAPDTIRFFSFSAWNKILVHIQPLGGVSNLEAARFLKKQGLSASGERVIVPFDSDEKLIFVDVGKPDPKDWRAVAAVERVGERGPQIELAFKALSGIRVEAPVTIPAGLEAAQNGAARESGMAELFQREDILVDRATGRLRYRVTKSQTSPIQAVSVVPLLPEFKAGRFPAALFRNAYWLLRPSEIPPAVEPAKGRIQYGFPGPVQRVVFQRGGGAEFVNLVVALGGRRIRTYDWTTGSEHQNILLPELTLAATFSSNEDAALLIHPDGAEKRILSHMYHYRHKGKTLPFGFPLPRWLNPHSLSISRDRGSLLVTGQELREARIQNLRLEDASTYEETKGIVARMRPKDGSKPVSGAFHPKGDVVAIGTNSGRVELWRFSKAPGSQKPPELIAESQEHGGVVHVPFFSPDGRTLVTGDSSGNLRVWDWSHRQGRLKLRHSLSLGAVLAIRSVSFLPVGDPRNLVQNSRIVAAAGEDGQIYFWDAVTGQQLARIQPDNPAPIRHISFSWTGTKVAAGRDESSPGEKDYSMAIWEVPSAVTQYAASLGRPEPSSSDPSDVPSTELKSGLEMKEGIRVRADPDSLRQVSRSIQIAVDTDPNRIIFDQYEFRVLDMIVEIRQTVYADALSDPLRQVSHQLNQVKERRQSNRKELGVFNRSSRGGGGHEFQNSWRVRAGERYAAHAAMKHDEKADFTELRRALRDLQKAWLAQIPSVEDRKKSGLEATKLDWEDHHGAEARAANQAADSLARVAMQERPKRVAEALFHFWSAVEIVLGQAPAGRVAEGKLASLLEPDLQQLGSFYEAHFTRLYGRTTRLLDGRQERTRLRKTAEKKFDRMFWLDLFGNALDKAQVEALLGKEGRGVIAAVEIPQRRPQPAILLLETPASLSKRYKEGAEVPSSASLARNVTWLGGEVHKYVIGLPTDLPKLQRELQDAARERLQREWSHALSHLLVYLERPPAEKGGDWKPDPMLNNDRLIRQRLSSLRALGVLAQEDAPWVAGFLVGIGRGRINAERAREIIEGSQEISLERPFVTEGDVETLVEEADFFLKHRWVPERDPDPVPQIIARMDRNKMRTPFGERFQLAVAEVVAYLRRHPEEKRPEKWRKSLSRVLWERSGSASAAPLTIPAEGLTWSGLVSRLIRHSPGEITLIRRGAEKDSEVHFVHRPASEPLLLHFSRSRFRNEALRFDIVEGGSQWRVLVHEPTSGKASVVSPDDAAAVAAAQQQRQAKASAWQVLFFFSPGDGRDDAAVAQRVSGLLSGMQQAAGEGVKITREQIGVSLDANEAAAWAAAKHPRLVLWDGNPENLEHESLIRKIARADPSTTFVLYLDRQEEGWAKGVLRKQPHEFLFKGGPHPGAVEKIAMRVFGANAAKSSGLEEGFFPVSHFAGAPFALGTQLHGSTIRVALVNEKGEVSEPREIRWRELKKVRSLLGNPSSDAEMGDRIQELIPRTAEETLPPERQARANAIGRTVLREMRRAANGLVRQAAASPDLDLLPYVYSSFATPVDERKGIVSPATPMANIPGIYRAPFRRGFGRWAEQAWGIRPLEDECNDSISGLDGEMSPTGTAFGFTRVGYFIWGTGMNGGDVLRFMVEMGHRLVARLGEDELIHYRLDKGRDEAGRLLVRPPLAKGEEELEDRLRGFSLGLRCAGSGFGRLEEVTAAAADEQDKLHAQAVGLVRGIGQEFGRALAVIFHEMRREHGGFIFERFVLGGGVAQGFARGAKDGDGRDLLIGAIQDGVVQELTRRFDYSEALARQLADGIVRSKMGSGRDFAGAAVGLRQILAGRARQENWLEIRRALKDLNGMDDFWTYENWDALRHRPILLHGGDPRVVPLAQALSVIKARDKEKLMEVEFRLLLPEEQREQVVAELREMDPMVAEEFLATRIVTYGGSVTEEEAKQEALRLLLEGKGHEFRGKSPEDLHQSRVICYIPRITSGLAQELAEFFGLGGLRFLPEPWEALKALLEAV